MAYEIIMDEENPKKNKKELKRHTIKKPKDISGKFGFSLMLGNKEIFFGMAVAHIETETYIKKRRLKVLNKAKKGTFRVADFD